MEKKTISKQDPTAESRKQDHIDLAFRSQVDSGLIDPRFSYEPMLSAHPMAELGSVRFLGKTLRTPIWVSSMTGGTEKARTINQNLARACREFGMGMGLGSCRQLLDSSERLPDFDFRNTIGDELPFYANLGIAQLEQLVLDKEVFKVSKLIDTLQADGLIIHVNPLQEWLQPEGDRLTMSPLKTIGLFLEQFKGSVIVKEVGQGMGRESLKALMQLPIDAIEFAAHGGTNFARLELLRDTPEKMALYEPVSRIGHSAGDMTRFVNDIIHEIGPAARCRQFIISGGIKNFLDGHYWMKKLQAKSVVYGQASTLLHYAADSYEKLEAYLHGQVEGLKLANAYFVVND
jgi:isopentenyl-diphosphate Delta-isomerase